VILELSVRDLGVIAELRLLLGPGMTALTGETGAGKTLVVDAIELLVGGRADPMLVRAGADEAWVEGRFVQPGGTPSDAGGDAGDEPGDEIVLARAIPRSGRSRAYIDGRLATAGELAQVGAELVDLHGQHAHQSLLHAAAQREALDRFGHVDLGPLQAARREIAAVLDELRQMGGDERARARELDLLRYQVADIDAASITGPDEDAQLERLEDELADATAHREAATGAVMLLSGDGTGGAPGAAESAADAVGSALALVAGRAPFGDAEARLRTLAAELSDVAGELRVTSEAIDEDPERLAEVRERRQLLHDLRRRYGETLADVLAEGDRLRVRLGELEDRLAAARSAEGEAAAKVAAARRDAAPLLAAEVQAHLAELALPKAQVEVVVRGEDPADDVELRLAANPGTPPLPLAKVASGGELARTMLALRLVLTAAPPTLVFDEVDAGVGGAAAVAVGRSLARLAGQPHQVFVVTHLPQVAAYADAQVRVTKRSDESTTVAQASVLADPDRVVELSRMLSGQPDSDAARVHAAELLTTAAAERGG
jgi:DNA repair protein RecN (Recombination protein N)